MDITWRTRFKSWFSDVKPVIFSPIFRKSVALVLSTTMLVGGFISGLNYRAAEEHKRLLTVSSVNEETKFAISGVPITFREQFLSGSLFVIPFDIESFNTLSTDASNYEVWLQGVMAPLDDSAYKVKLVLFGQSGSGAILIDGPFDGKPFNVYVHSMKTIVDVSSLTDISKFELKRDDVTLTDLESMDFISAGATTAGKVVVNGRELPVTQDIAFVTVNPLAENVGSIPNLTYDMSVGYVYGQTVGVKDRKLIETNRSVVANAKDQLKAQLEEFEARLDRDTSLSATQVRAIKDANRYAYNSKGDLKDIKYISKILSNAGLEDLDGGGFLSGTASTNTKEIDRSGVDLSQFTKVSGVTPQIGLAMIRQQYMQLNQKLDGFDKQLKVVSQLEKGQDQIASVMDNQEQVRFIRPF